MATQGKWKRSLGAPFPFIADTKAKIMKAYGVKMPIVRLARRTTFVVDTDMTIVRVDSGTDALDPTRAVAAC